MGRLVLNVQNSVLEGAGSLDQEWTIQLLRTDELVIPSVGQSLPSSPGILIVIPLEGLETHLVAGTSTQLFPGTALILNGMSCERLRYPDSAEMHGATARIGLIELNMSLNDTQGVCDVIHTPNLLDSRLGAEMFRLHQELTSAFVEGSLSADMRKLQIPMLSSQLVCALLQSSESSADATTREGSREEELKGLLSSELEKNLTMADLAKHFAMPRASFAYWANRTLGCAPMRYRRSLRLVRGRELLSASELSIDQIADSLGFFDRYHFSKLFKKEFSVTPAKYRRSRAESDKPATPFQLFRHNQFSEALDRCEKELRRVRDKEQRKRLAYLQFQCLMALGRSYEAVSVWDALKGSVTVLNAGMQLARMLYDEGKYGESLSMLDDVLQSDREGDRELAIQVWADQVIGLLRQRLGQPLRNYLDLRSRLFIDDVKTIPISNYALRLLGNLEKAVDHSRQSRETLSSLYYQMGRYDEAVATVPLSLRPKMVEKVSLRRTDTIPWSDDIELLKQGKAEELLNQSQPETGSHIHALHALGQLDQLRNYPGKGSFMWHYAQLYGNPRALLDADYPESPEFIHHARLLLLFDALRDKRDADASRFLSELQDIQSPDFFWEDHKWAGVFLSAVIRGILVDPAIANATWNVVHERYRYNNQQVPWHMAGYLLGQVSKEEFLNQPDRVYAIDRWPFLTAIERDLSGSSRSAQTAYRKCLETASPYRYLYLYRFLQWRCGQEW